MRQDQSDDRSVQISQKGFLTAAPAVWTDVLCRFGAARLRATGTSMFPVIRSGDVLSIRRCTLDDVHAGDIVLVHDGDRLFAHRLTEKNRSDAGAWLVTRGDSHWRMDPRRRASNLLGLVTAVERYGRVIAPPFHCSWWDRVRGLAFAAWTPVRRAASAHRAWFLQMQRSTASEREASHV